MRLDERSQQALVVIVQNAIDERLEEVGEESQKNRVREQMEMLTNQNEVLREELEEYQVKENKYKRQLAQLRDRLEELEEIDYKQRKQTL